MSNSDNQNFNNDSTPISRLEEDELWDLEEEWDGADESTAVPPVEGSPPAEVDPSLQPEEPTTPEPTDNLGDQDTFADPATISPAQEIEPTSPDEDKESEEIQKSTLSGLSLIEKATLAVLAAALLGLAIYSYTWLYKKNLTAEEAKLELPVQGDYITISNFSTHWTEGSGNSTKILPVASITLDPDANAAGALRIYFRDAESNIIGDPITLAVSNSKFVVAQSHSIKISDDGATAEVISSDGFNQESDFSAYVLDKNMAWKAFVFEANRADAPGREFEKHEIISVKIDAKRK